MSEALAASKANDEFTALRRKNGAEVVRIGLLGLGKVGQAVVRLIGDMSHVLRKRGLNLVVTGSLVRDVCRWRTDRVPGALLTCAPDTFLSRDYDVTIEVLGGIEPANTPGATGGLSASAAPLRAAVPVVTANKSLLAAEGERLQTIADETGTRATGGLSASAAPRAGVPFLGMLDRRPLAVDVKEITGILNGTSNYILAAMQTEGVSPGATGGLSASAAAP